MRCCWGLCGVCARSQLDCPLVMDQWCLQAECMCHARMLDHAGLVSRACSADAAACFAAASILCRYTPFASYSAMHRHAPLLHMHQPRPVQHKHIS